MVAIIEQVKNAYDADASRVMIRFVPPLEPGRGRIEVLDNGHGMSLATVRTVWMEPATISKRTQDRSEKFKRRYLGEKGIGRFASARLAEELEVISKRKDSKHEVFALFDWTQFDDENKYLDEVVILWDERDPVDITSGGLIETLWQNEEPGLKPLELNHGTILRMSRLRQKWESQHFEELTRGLARLVSRPKGDASKTRGDEFEIELNLPEEFNRFSVKIEPPAILSYPHYVVSGRVNADGSYDFVYKLKSTGAEERQQGRFVRIANRRGQYELRTVPLQDADLPDDTRGVECGPLDIELRIWDRDELGNVVQKTHSSLRDIRRDLDTVAGINLYRDGFRVLPYGEPQDDWLRLDIRRVQNPTFRLSNNQIYGVIHISADTNPSLKDQSNREGLDETQGLTDLREIILDLLGKLEPLRYNARPRTETKGKAVGGLFSGFNFKPLGDYISRTLPQDQNAKELIEKTEQEFGGQLKEIQTVLARYQRLATLGQLIDHVLHEGRQPIATINNEADLGLAEIRRGKEPKAGWLPHLLNRFTVIRKQGDVLATAFRRMEPFGGRRRGRPAQFYVEDVFREAFAVLGEQISRLNVQTVLPTTQTLVRVDPAEIQEVIINLLQNSLYWLEQVVESKRKIAVKIERRVPEELEIYFSDSGPGVPLGNRESIFDPYFSTRSEGVGLGLSIVGQIVSDYYGGSLELMDHGPLSGANFKITLRKRV